MQKQQKILITGTSSGFGLATAKTLAKNGHTVFATMRDVGSRNKEQKDALLRWAKENEANVHIIELDVTSDESVQSALKEILERTEGRLDVIINNAGIFGGGIQEAFTIDDHKTIFEVNVFGSVRINNALLPVLRKQGSGLIIQISSVVGRLVMPYNGVYDATKFALEALTENLHYGLKPLGIDAVIVQPGLFATELISKLYEPTNQSIVGEYGVTAQMMGGFFGNVEKILTDPNIPNKVQDVADVILNLVEMQQGKRPLRVVVDKIMGDTTEAINETASKMQAGVLQNFGLGELAVI